jgi:disulfide oxidoreductase YuzD
MALTESLFFQKASGHMARQFVFKQYNGKTFITKYPDMSKRILSEKQLKNNKRMEQANYNAREIMADEELCKNAQVRLNVTRNRLYTALIREYFTDEKAKEAAEEIVG